MSRITLTLAVLLTLGLPLSSQSFPVRVTRSASVDGALRYEIPSLHLKPAMLAPSAGHRLHIVSLVLDEEPVETEPRRFMLVTSTGTYEPIGAGGGEFMIVPFDRVPIGKEVGVVLRSDALVVLTRTSATMLTLEAGPHATMAFLYEVPLGSSVRALRLPDGRELLAAP